MFTGIIENLGSVSDISKINGGLRLSITSPEIANEVKINDSISVNGICLTVTGIKMPAFLVEAVGATLTKTTISDLKIGSLVNLERALKAEGRFDGHFVQGHVNDIGTVNQIKKLGENYYFQVKAPENLLRYFIAEGSVAIDGISLTIADLNMDLLGFSIIPHTWHKTNLQFRKKTERVNIEVDMIAKYIENFVLKSGKTKSKITIDWLKESGY